VNKTLKPILAFSDMHYELKDACHKILNCFMKNLKKELFENFEEIKKIKYSISSTAVEKSLINNKNFMKELEMELMMNVANKANDINQNEEFVDDPNDCMVRTDTKYLNYIKRIEMNMFLESKRRIKTKRMESNQEENTSNTQEDDSSEDNISMDIDEKESKEKNSNETKNSKEENNSNSNININNISNSNSKNCPKNKNSNTGTKNSPNEKLLNKKIGRYQNANTNINIFDVTESNEKKLLRSNRFSKNSLNVCYELYSNSESVIKGVKSNRRKNNVKEEIPNKQDVYNTNDIQVNNDRILESEMKND
jgi:hypothetical protein